jgi:hypothetical protein
MAVDGWRIHHRIGMSGGLFTRALARELGRELTAEEATEIQGAHGALYRVLAPTAATATPLSCGSHSTSSAWASGIRADPHIIPVHETMTLP